MPAGCSYNNTEKSRLNTYYQGYDTNMLLVELRPSFEIVIVIRYVVSSNRYCMDRASYSYDIALSYDTPWKDLKTKGWR